MNTIKIFSQRMSVRAMRPRALLVSVVLVSVLLASVVMGGSQSVFAAGTGPCDIYASGGTPCVAAHSTVRALFGAYNGNLYQVRRSSDNTTRDIGVLSAGGIANAAAQDSFCAGTTCVITIIYDQSGRGNHLTVAPAGGAGGADTPSNATAAQITINGNKAYGVFIAAGNGYRRNSTSGIATGDQAEAMYAIFDGTHFNGGCCFDYGNAETNNLDNGAGHMEAIYFGNIKVWTFGTGNGPWVMADLENGLFGCAASPNGSLCSNNPTISNRFVTAMVKGHSGNSFGLKEGNAQSGGLATVYNGARPNGYSPMHKEGAIILGIGGDNSKTAVGTFYEGVMVSGDPSDATDNAVQANIVAAGYGSGASGGNLLTNGNIESGTSGWSVFGSGSLSAVTSPVHGGTQSLLLTGRTASWNGPSQDLTSKVTNGNSYTTNVWMRLQSGTATGKVTMAVTANGTTNYIQLASGAVNSTGWTLLSGTTTVSWSGTLSTARFYVETTSGTPSFYIDDASIQ